MQLIGENPVLQRELLVNLRTFRSFIMLAIYQLALSGVVYLAWPNVAWLDLTENPESTRTLVDLFFLGNYVIVSLLTPTFAAGSISGEKERKTYEMLLASPLQPQAIVWGKLAAALTHLAILIFSSLPVVMLCLPLGGVSIYEVLAAYVGLISSVVAFGMISVACGGFFKRTSAALVVSYLLILPIVLLAIAFWYLSSSYGQYRVNFTIAVIPGLAATVTILLFYVTAGRMLYPSDLGGQSGEVLDLEQESEVAVGLVLTRDQFPDNLIVPPLRKSLMEDNTNPVYDKEMRSEIFGQGTLMLRMAIQISMVLAIFFMAAFLFLARQLTPWYFCYVLLYNMLLGPVFSAGSVTSERERQTLDLLLTTMLTPWQILFGKMTSSLRVSAVLTSFLLFPVLLAMIGFTYWQTLPSMVVYLLVVVLACLTTTNIALACSTLFRKTSTSLVVSYLILVILYLLPVAVDFFASNYLGELGKYTHWMTATSPFATVHNFPIYVDDISAADSYWKRGGYGSAGTLFGFPLADMRHFAVHLAFTVMLNIVVFGSLIWMFHKRWRVSSSSN